MTAVLQKISFADASRELQILCEEIDNVDELTSRIQEMFAEKFANLADAVDRRIKFIRYAESQVFLAKGIKSQMADRIDRFERVIATIKQDTEEIIRATPNVPFRGTLGSFSLRKNSVPSLVLDGEQLPDEYKRIERVPDTALIKRELSEGKTIPGAELRQGEHLRINLV